MRLNHDIRDCRWETETLKMKYIQKATKPIEKFAYPILAVCTGERRLFRVTDFFCFLTVKRFLGHYVPFRPSGKSTRFRSQTSRVRHPVLKIEFPFTSSLVWVLTDVARFFFFVLQEPMNSSRIETRVTYFMNR